MMANDAAKLACARPLYAVHLEDGGRVDARALIIASGAQYRRPAIANLSKFEGAGVYYAAFRMESQLCVGEEVVIVDGGNSAGQAAVFLADAAMLVQLLVRKDGLADTMSRYLIRRIDDHPAITLIRKRSWWHSTVTGISLASSGAIREPAWLRREISDMCS
jgi:thioredoxin reductase (NADPH)